MSAPLVRTLAWILAAMPAASLDGGLPAEGAVEVPRPAPVKGADLQLLEDVRELADRLAQLRGRSFERAPLAVRASAETRRGASLARAGALLDRRRLAARGRAWADVGLGGSDGPRRLLERLAADLDGAAIDAGGNRLLVDPERLRTADFHTSGDSAEPPALLRHTGVRPDEPLLVHLLTHLLRAPASDAPRTTDRLLAEHAWREGEANLAALIYLFRPMGIAADVVGMGLRPEEVLDGGLVPGGLAEPVSAPERLLDFVYGDGFDAVVAQFRDGGWQAVERAAALRRTTRDLLHADRAPLGSAPSAPPGTPEPALPGGYVLADTDVLGEQALIVLIALGTGKENLGLIAGDGWAGDALHRFERDVSDAEGGLTRWITRWTDDEAAADFEYAYLRTLKVRFPDAPPVSPRDGLHRVEANGRVVQVKRLPREVRVRVAPEWLDRMLGTEEPAQPAPR